MSLFSDGFPFGIGETMIGTDNGVLVNKALEGREAYISHDAIPNDGSPLFSARVGVRSKIRIMRNTTGGILYAGEIAIYDHVVGAGGTGSATAKSSANSRFAVVVDPTIGTAGVADDDLFIAFVRGPAKIKAPAAGITPAVTGQPIKSGATGRFASAGLTGTENHLILGSLLADTTAIAANALVDCILHPAWE